MFKLTAPLLLAFGLVLSACAGTTSTGSTAGDELGSTQHMHRSKGHIYDKGP